MTANNNEQEGIGGSSSQDVSPYHLADGRNTRPKIRFRIFATELTGAVKRGEVLFKQDKELRKAREAMGQGENK